MPIEYIAEHGIILETESLASSVPYAGSIEGGSEFNACGLRPNYRDTNPVANTTGTRTYTSERPNKPLQDQHREELAIQQSQNAVPPKLNLRDDPTAATVPPNRRRPGRPRKIVQSKGKQAMGVQAPIMPEHLQPGVVTCLRAHGMSLEVAEAAFASQWKAPIHTEANITPNDEANSVESDGINASVIATTSMRGKGRRLYSLRHSFKLTN
jgi:hypothetical protein